MLRNKAFSKFSRRGIAGLLMLAAGLIFGAGQASALDLNLPGCGSAVQVNDRATTETHTPVILFPPKDGFVRGDSLCSNYFIWKVQTQPTFQYILAINKISGPGGKPLPGLDAIVRSIPKTQVLNVPGQNTIHYITFDYNAELENLGSGFYRAGLAAVGDAGVYIAGSVEFRKGTTIGKIVIDPIQCDLNRINFNLSIDDPDNTPPYEYAIRFISTQGHPQVGPFLVSTSAAALTRDAFPNGFESQFVPGTDYTMELQVRDDINNINSPASIGPIATKPVHINAPPVITEVSSPVRVETVKDGPTFVDISVTAMDDESSDLSVIFSVSRDSAPFVELAQRSMMPGTSVFSIDVNALGSLPFPANGTYLFQVQVFDRCDINTNNAASNLEFSTTFISDTPQINGINPTTEGQLPDGLNFRFDFPLIETFPTFGIVNAPIDYAVTSILNDFSNPVSFLWQFFDAGQAPVPTSTDPTPQYLYASAQRTTTSLTVTDTLGFNSSRAFNLIINDIPKVEVSTVGNARLTAPNTWTMRRGDTAIFIATAYNYVAGDDNAIGFDWITTGTTIVPITYPAQLQNEFVPDFPGGPLVSLAQPVPAGRGPIVDVDVVNLITQQRFTEPAADFCENAPALSTGPISISDPGTGGLEGSSTLDDIIFTASDDCATTTPPPVAPNLIYTVDTSGADASGFSFCDVDPLPAQTEDCDLGSMSLNTPALMALGTALPVNTQGATLEGSTTCDFDPIPAALDACNPLAPSINPPALLAINSFGMSPFDGFSSCDVDSAPLATDVCDAEAQSITPPMLLAVDTNGAALDGESSADLDVFGAPSDLCLTAPAIGPSLTSFAIDPTGATPSIGLVSACGDTPMANDFCTSAPQVTTGITLPLNTLYASVGLLGNEALSSCEMNPGPITFEDFCASLTPSLTVGSFPVSTVGYSLDTYYDANGGAILPPADACVDAPPVIPGVYVLSTVGATTNTGISAANILVVGDPTDNFNAAPVIRPGQIYSFAVNDNDSLDEATCDLNNLDFDRYYIYTPAISGTASFSFNATPASADKVISIHPAGAAATDGNTLACDAENSNGDPAEITDFAVTGGTSYLIRLAGSQDGQYTLNFTGPDPFVDVFYTYSPGLDGQASFTLTDVDPGATISVHSGCPATDLNDIVSASAAINTTSVTLSVTSDTTYIIRVSTPLQDPNVGLEVTGPDTQHDGYFTYVPAQTGPVTLALTGSPANSVLSLHSAGCPVGPALAVSQTSNSQQATITANVIAGQSYKVRIATVQEISGINLLVSGVDSKVDVYYSYTPSADGLLEISGLGLSALANASVSIYDGCGGLELDCASVVLGTVLTPQVAVTAGQTYIVRYSTDLENNNGSLTLTGPDAVGRPRNDVWYSYTPRLDGVATLTLAGSATDTLLAVYDGCGGTELECSVTTLDNQAEITIPVTANQNYRIRLATPPGAGVYDLNLSGPDQVGRPRQDVFFTYRPATAGQTTVTLVGSPDDSVLSVHTDCPATQVNEVASTRTLGSTQATVSFVTTPGVTYFIRTAAPFNIGGYSYNIDVQGPLPVGRPRQDVFYRYQPRTTGPATITLNNSPGGTTLSVHDDCPATSTNELVCDSTGASQATVAFNAVANMVYYIRIAAPNNASGYQFEANVTGPPMLGRPRQDVFYNYQPRENGPVTLRLVGSPDDTVLSVHTACPADNANQLDCTITTGSQQAELIFNAVANTEYAIRIAAPNNNALGYQFDLEVEGPDAVGRPRQDVFYSYTPRINGVATFSLIDSPNDSVLSLHSSCPTSTSLDSIDCDVTNSESQAEVTIAVTANQTYTVRIAAPYNSAGQPFAFTMTGPDRSGRPRRDVFWKYTPATSGNVVMNLNASPFDTVLSIHSDCPATTSTEITASRTTGAGQAQVNFAATAGVPYLVRIASPEDALAPFFLQVAGPEGLGDFFSDLTASLTGAGQTVQLFSGLCAQQVGLAGPFSLNDQAALPIGADRPPLAGSAYIPEQSLGVYNESSPTGNWQLTLQDAKILDIGTLNDWGVRISTREFAQPTNAFGSQIANSAAPVFNQIIAQTFNESGVYTFNIQTSEKFGPDTLLSDPLKVNVIVLDDMDNTSAVDWALYR